MSELMNSWSYGKKTRIEVWYDDYWLNYEAGKFARNVIWKGQTIRVQDYDWFYALIKSWIKDKFYPMTKEQALDLWFEVWEGHDAKV